MYKEWMQLRWKLLIYIVANSAVLSWGVDRLVFGVPKEILTSNQTMIGLCFALHVIMAVSLLLNSLGKDRGRVDVWLHTPVSMRQLVGAKFLLVFIAVAFSLVLSGIIASISYFVGGEVVSVASDVVLLLQVGVVVLLNVLYVMAVVFFFWAMYQVVRSRLGWIAIIVLIVSVNVWLYGWGVVWFTAFFQTVKEIGPMDGPIQTIDLLMVNNYIVPGGTILTVGSLVLYGLLTVLYFVVGSTLFEKKVRL